MSESGPWPCTAVAMHCRPCGLATCCPCNVLPLESMCSCRCNAHSKDSRASPHCLFACSTVARIAFLISSSKMYSRWTGM